MEGHERVRKAQKTGEEKKKKKTASSKGQTVEPKLKILSFTHYHVDSKFICFVEHKNIFANMRTRVVKL